MSFSPLIRQLIDAFRVLPGVGQKTAQRMALQLLERDRSGGQRLADALSQAMEGVGYCRQCRSLSEEEVCHLCSDQRRDESLLCIVQGPMDVFAVEQTGYRGRYFVLGGHLPPIDGISADDLNIDQLVWRVKQEPVEELILATGTTVEGQTTAHFISEAVSRHVNKVTRLAQGVPMGGELEYLDSMTLGQALQNRSFL